MKFGPISLELAEGAVLAHATEAGGRRLRKAHVLTRDDVGVLRAAGLEHVIAAVLEPGDVAENAAAERVARTLSARNIDARPPSTGRVNLHARSSGLFTVDADLVNSVNAIDQSVTVATLAHASVVEAGQMVATVKIIPFAVPESVLDAVERATAGATVYGVEEFRSLKVGLIQTTLQATKMSALDKTARVTAARLARSGSRITEERRPAHELAPITAAIGELVPQCDLVIIFGASAVCDIDDVVPLAIRAAGGKVLRLGMPVDPGNLLVLAKCQGISILSAPGCARSPKENGFDWVLDRLTAGVEITSAEVAGMGVGGLLMEIATRPQPREVVPAAASPKVAAIVLAAGQSRRMGGANKLLARFGGKETLVARAVDCALEGGPVAVSVVTGHQADRIVAALEGRQDSVRCIHNPNYADGLAGSLKAGIASLPAEADGALVMLADMPAVSSEDLRRLISAFVAAGGNSVVRATHDGKRGNPVILPRAVFPAVSRLEGDTGARHLIENEGMPVIDVEIGPAASLDVDTREALSHAGGVLET